MKTQKQVWYVVYLNTDPLTNEVLPRITKKFYDHKEYVKFCSGLMTSDILSEWFEIEDEGGSK